MPFDPLPVETTPFTLEDLISWLMAQDPDVRYDYFDCKNCMLYKYGRDRGLDIVSVGGDYYNLPSRRVNLPEGVAYAAAGDPFTYGAALERAKALRDAG